MKRLLYSVRAIDDLKGILNYIARDNPTAARSFIDGIIETCGLLPTSPEIGRSRDDLAPALRLITHRRYGIYYRNLKTEVLIERVLHPSLDVHGIDTQT